MVLLVTRVPIIGFIGNYGAIESNGNIGIIGSNISIEYKITIVFNRTNSWNHWYQQEPLVPTGTIGTNRNNWYQQEPLLEIIPIEHGFLGCLLVLI